jgi:hypothetical protein
VHFGVSTGVPNEPIGANEQHEQQTSKNKITQISAKLAPIFTKS